MALLNRLRSLLTNSSRAAAADVQPYHRTIGIPQDWTPTTYGEYYAKSVPVYSAINVRASAFTQAPLQARRRLADGTLAPLDPTHRLQQIVDRPNPHFTGPELWQALEIYKCLWGRAHLSIETIEGQVQLWPIRPDRLHTIAGEGQGPHGYIKGYVYEAEGGHRVAYLPEEIITFQFFNPLQDRTGLSPLAPLRLSADMGLAATKYNRNTFANGGIPDFLIFQEGSVVDAQAQEFYKRWEERFKGEDKSHRPAFVGGAKDVKALAFSQREMEFIETLHFTIGEAVRTLGVPAVFLGETRDATLANVQVYERILWRQTMIPELSSIEARLNTFLLPRLDYGPQFRLQFDLSGIDVLTEQEEPRLRRETEYMDRGAMTINEVRNSRGLRDMPGGNDPDAPARRRWNRATPPGQEQQPAQQQPAQRTE